MKISTYTDPEEKWIVKQFRSGSEHAPIIACEIGHSSGGPGFKGLMDRYEYQWAMAPGYNFGQLAMANGIDVDLYDRSAPGLNWYDMKDLLNERHAERPYALHFQLHFDDGNKSCASGTHCIFWHNSRKGKLAAHMFAKCVGSHLELNSTGWDGLGGCPLDGDKTKDPRFVYQLVKYPTPPSIIIEHGYADTKRDADAMMERRQTVHRSYLNALMEYFEALS